MSIVKKIPMLVFSYVHDHGMDKDSLSAEDFVLAQDIETRMTSVFHINNKKVNGKDTSFKFSDVKQMEFRSKLVGQAFNFWKDLFRPFRAI